MDRNAVIEDIKKRLEGDIIEVFDKSPKRLYVGIKPEALRKAVRYFFEDLGARFNIASGVDTRGHMEILYHFTLEDINLLISLRVMLSKEKLEIDSLASLFEGANWIEREMNELLGIKFNGHPDMRRLLLPDEWPEGVYPLRCDYREWDKDAIRDRGV